MDALSWLGFRCAMTNNCLDHVVQFTYLVSHGNEYFTQFGWHVYAQYETIIVTWCLVNVIV